MKFPFSTPERLDIDPFFAKLREEEPVTRITLPYGGDGWLITRHEDVKTVLTDARFSRAAAVGKGIPSVQPIPPIPELVMWMDPPEHTRLRKLVTKEFTTGRVEAMRPWVRETVTSMLDDMVAAGQPADLVEHLSLPLPVMVICELLGVPYADRERFRHWSDAQMATTQFDVEAMVAAQQAMYEYFMALISERRVDPKEDLLSALVQAHDDGERLSEGELVAMAITLLVTGHETTAMEITNFTYLLLRHPEKYAALCSDPSRVPTAVEEMLRYVPLDVGGSYGRIAVEDVELSGVTVREGDAVFVSSLSANRDLAVFADPEELDLERENNPHLSFGAGVHYCLGARLARMELQEALGAIVKRFPALRVAVPEEEIQWRKGMIVRGPLSLPVGWA
ncbi:cytochrome P450 [Allokutzneria multivorans]|uniref:Cytochrome P450 n=1 Tax=Allokutzneria multivorans TaxID=1142134 RepID=A0ABP7R0T9_9PSEU